MREWVGIVFLIVIGTIIAIFPLVSDGGDGSSWSTIMVSVCGILLVVAIVIYVIIRPNGKILYESRLCVKASELLNYSKAFPEVEDEGSVMIYFTSGGERYTGKISVLSPRSGEEKAITLRSVARRGGNVFPYVIGFRFRMEPTDGIVIRFALRSSQEDEYPEGVTIVVKGKRSRRGRVEPAERRGPNTSGLDS